MSEKTPLSRIYNPVASQIRAGYRYPCLENKSYTANINIKQRVNLVAVIDVPFAPSYGAKSAPTRNIRARIKVLKVCTGEVVPTKSSESD
jgi:hypothetical protein